MRARPTALAWINPDVSVAFDVEAIQVRSLARRLGYVLVWPDERAVLSLMEQVRWADVDAVITPAPNHFDLLTLHNLMMLADVETVWPRISFARWCVL
ncbi:hypothetical protein [Nocardia cyriacigeorgica]|uniref:hypothetical protein n=1 Tax=Nocardia cyriacigeorgica TaxID=135487 RepID=UPI002457D4AA|nr:hypothetical protein [Nocardia cyriacigeorgica]